MRQITTKLWAWLNKCHGDGKKRGKYFSRMAEIMKSFGRMMIHLSEESVARLWNRDFHCVIGILIKAQWLVFTNQEQQVLCVVLVLFAVKPPGVRCGAALQMWRGVNCRFQWEETGQSRSFWTRSCDLSLCWGEASVFFCLMLGLTMFFSRA